MKLPAKPVLLGVGLVAMLGGLLVLLRPAPIVVETATVEEGELMVTVIEEGRTRIQERHVVSSPVAGYLQRLAWDEGDPITQGQAIARIDPITIDSEVQSLLAEIDALQAEKDGVQTLRPKDSRLLQADADIAAAEASIQGSLSNIAELEARLKQAIADRERAEYLQETGAISDQALESAELLETGTVQQLETAQQEQKQFQAALQQTKALRQQLAAEQQDPDYLLSVYDAQIRSLEANLAERVDQARRTEITSPTSGQVLRLYTKSQQYIEAGVPLLELGTLQDLELVVDVLSSDATQIQTGNEVIIEQWGGDRPLNGKVKRIEPAAFTKVSALGVEEQRVNVIVELNEIPPNLGDQYRVEAHIVVWQDEQALQVPISALFRCEEDWCVFRVDNNQAQRTTIELGQKTAIAAQIISGLNADDQVIIYPSEQIQDGSSVKIQ